MIGLEIVGVSLLLPVMRNGNQGNKKYWLRLGNGREVLLVVAVKITTVVFVSDLSFVSWQNGKFQKKRNSLLYRVEKWRIQQRQY